MSERKTVLLVDDERTVRRLVRETLEVPALRVLEAGDGWAALALVARERPDLVLLDVEMPGLDGHAVCARIKGDPQTRGTQVIMLTAQTGIDHLRRSAESGADGYVAKPFSPRVLVGAVTRLLTSPQSVAHLPRQRARARWQGHALLTQLQTRSPE